MHTTRLLTNSEKRCVTGTENEHKNENAHWPLAANGVLSQFLLAASERAARMFETSFDAAVDGIDWRLRSPRKEVDTGRPVSAGEYALTDRTYDRLLVKLEQKKFDGVTPQIRENILAFYDGMKSPDQHGIGRQLDALRAYRPAPFGSAENVYNPAR